MKNHPIRVGLIGASPDRGWAAAAHIPALRAVDDYRLVGVANRSRASAEAAARHFSIPRAFDSPQALVTDPEIDLVVVTVRVSQHRDLVMAALDAGKPVFCEWPLGHGLAESRELATTARERGIHTAIGLQWRFAPAFAKARALVAQGYVGEILSATLVGSGIGWGPQTHAADLYSYDAKSGATMLMISVGHMVDALCDMLGEPVSVQAVSANRRRLVHVIETDEQVAVTAPDQFAFVATLEGGPLLSVHYRGGLSRGTNFLCEINGSEGDLRLTFNDRFELELMGATASQTSLAPILCSGAPDPNALHGPAAYVADLYRQLAQDFETGRTTVPNFDTATRRHAMLETIERAAATGERVFVQRG